jgi:hypothetical protein
MLPVNTQYAISRNGMGIGNLVVLVVDGEDCASGQADTANTSVVQRQPQIVNLPVGVCDFRLLDPER